MWDVGEFRVMKVRYHSIQRLYRRQKNGGKGGEKVDWGKDNVQKRAKK